MGWVSRYAKELVSTAPAKVISGVGLIASIPLAIFVSDLRFLWLFFLALVVIAVQAAHAYRLDKSAPKLSFGQPIIGPLQDIQVPIGGDHWQSLGSGYVVRVPVLNAHGAGDAEGLHATLRFTGSGGFERKQPGRWRDHPEDAEITIAGNERPNELDLCVQIPDSVQEQKCYVWNNASLVAGVRREDFRIDPQPFSLNVVLRGKHPRAMQERTWRVMAGIAPQIVPEGEKFSIEKKLPDIWSGS